MTDTTISTDPATLRAVAESIETAAVRMPPEHLNVIAILLGQAAINRAIAAEKEAQADLTRRLAEVTAERDAGRELMRQAWHELNAIRARAGAPDGVSHEWFDQLVTGIADCLGDDRVPWMTRAAKAIVRPYEARADAAEAALSRRDEALRVAREAIDELAGLMTSTEAAVLVPGRVPDFEGGYDKCVARARDAQDAIDALTKPQEAGDAGENG